MLRLLLPGSVLLKTLFFCSLVVITIASLLPSTGTMLFPMQDKFLHAGAYLYLYSLGGYSFTKSLQVVRYWSGWLFIGLVCYGVSIEWLQGLTGYRDRDPLDLLANVVGILLGVGLLAAYCHWQRLLFQPNSIGKNND